MDKLALVDRRLHLLRAKANRSWYRIENAASEDEAAIYIYDEIGYWGTTASQFVKDLGQVSAKSIRLHLNTPGGDVFDGIAIHNALRDHPATVHVQVDALAASIGSVIAMAGSSVTMAKHSTMMIHDPYGLAMGNAADMRQMSDVLDQIGDTIAGVYAERAGGSVREWRDRMLAETWYTDRAAVEAGLADEVLGDEDSATNTAENRAGGATEGRPPLTPASFDLSIFKNVPDSLAARASAPASAQAPTKRDLERVLRDAGLSAKQAKALLAAGYPDLEAEEPRDADAEALLYAFKLLL